MKKLLFTFVGALLLSGCQLTINNTPPETPADTSSATDDVSLLTEVEAKQIAESDCIKGGESVEPGYYNPNSKTWWFDANLNVSKEGCNPACVVSEDGSVEINWRCTGLMMDKEDITPIITNLFIEKFPDYADVLSVRVEKQTETHARGSISFGEGVGGGYFLAKKTDGEWEIVLDGNGGIPCTLSEQGFPEDMISDCY